MMHCGLRFKYHSFSRLVVSLTEFGEVAVKVSLYFDRHQPAILWLTPNLLYLRPPAPAAPAPQPAPLAAPAPEPAVVAPAPMVKEEVNFHSCYKSSLAFRFRQLGFSCTFFVVPLPMLFALHVFFMSSHFYCILCGFFGRR